MAELNSNQDRLAANHHRNREEASRVMVHRRRHRPVSPAIQPTLNAEQQASVALLGSRGMVSLSVMGGPSSGTGPAVERQPGWTGSARAEPAARLPGPGLAASRDRRRQPGTRNPAGHPAIGRPVLSPNIIPYRGP